jgi:hypothetical protein
MEILSNIALVALQLILRLVTADAKHSMKPTFNIQFTVQRHCNWRNPLSAIGGIAARMRKSTIPITANLYLCIETEMISYCVEVLGQVFNFWRIDR